MTRESEASLHALQGDDRVSGDAFLRQAGRGFLISMYAALRSLKLYPIENATAQKALDDVQAAAVSILEPQGEIELRISGDFIFVNGTRLRLELDNYAAFSNILAALRSVDLGEVKVLTGVERREWQIFLGVLLSLMEKGEERNPERLLDLREKLAVAGVQHIEVEPPLESEEKVAEAEQAREVAKRT
jgi:hypothetical protein